MAAAGIPAAEPKEWITPAIQLQRVYQRSPVYELLSGRLPPKGIPDIVLSYYPPTPTISAISQAFTALEKIGMLPSRIPSLPRHIELILNSKCPIRGDETNSDGTPRKVWQTQSLYLIPSGTLDELEARFKAYGEKHLTEYGGINPFQFSCFWDEARVEHGNTPFSAPRWILMTNEVIAKSRGEPLRVQSEIVKELNAKSLVTYEVPKMINAVAFTFLHKIATGRSVLEGENRQNEGVCTFTFVNETTKGYNLIVGNFTPSGLDVDYPANFNKSMLAVAVYREL